MISASSGSQAPEAGLRPSSTLMPFSDIPLSAFSDSGLNNMKLQKTGHFDTCRTQHHLNSLHVPRCVPFYNCLEKNQRTTSKIFSRIIPSLNSILPSFAGVKMKKLRILVKYSITLVVLHPNSAHLSHS
jgi:hypothetical protein